MNNHDLILCCERHKQSLIQQQDSVKLVMLQRSWSCAACCLSSSSSLCLLPLTCCQKTVENDHVLLCGRIYNKRSWLALTALANTLRFLCLLHKKSHPTFLQYNPLILSYWVCIRSHLHRIITLTSVSQLRRPQIKFL